MLATIIGGIAAVIGLGMAAIAIIASRSMKASQSGQATAADGHTPVSAEKGDQNVAINGNGNVNLTDTDSEPATDDSNAFTDPFAPDVAGDPNAFTDPFAPEVTNEEDTPEVWGSVFDDPAEHTETKWGFTGEDATESTADEVRPGTKETKEK